MKEQDYEHLPNHYCLGNLKLPDTSNIKLEKIVLSPLNESEGYRILEVVSTYRPGQLNWEYYTMLKIQDFSATQILREINFGHFEVPKTAILTI